MGMDTPMLEYVISCLQEAKGRWPGIADEAGISLRTLEKIARREVHDPRIGSVQVLYDHFRSTTQGAAA